MPSFRYPLTGRVELGGFAGYLAENLDVPRANIKAFGRELSAEFDTRYLTLVTSGSAANLCAALTCRELVKPGGEAIVAGFTFPTTIAALKLAGYSVRVVDTEPYGFNMDPASFSKALNKRTKIVCFTHFLGFPAQVEELCSIARAHGVMIIQDGCESLDLRINGRQAHSFGDMTTWSFYHPHHISSFGGGAIISNSKDHFRIIESISHWGRECTCHIDPATCTAPDGVNHNFHYVRDIGQNLEMSELNACFGRYQFQTWKQQEARRIKNYAILYNALSGIDGIKIYPTPPNSGSPSIFPITTLRHDMAEISQRLKLRGVETRSLMGGVVTGQPAFAKLRHDGLLNCRRMSQTSFMIGIHQTLPIEDVESVATILREELSCP